MLFLGGSVLGAKSRNFIFTKKAGSSTGVSLSTSPLQGQMRKFAERPWSVQGCNGRWWSQSFCTPLGCWKLTALSVFPANFWWDTIRSWGEYLMNLWCFMHPKSCRIINGIIPSFQTFACVLFYTLLEYSFCHPMWAYRKGLWNISKDGLNPKSNQQGVQMLTRSPILLDIIILLEQHVVRLHFIPYISMYIYESNLFL